VGSRTPGPGLVVEEHHVLLDGLAADVQLIGGEVWVAGRPAVRTWLFSVEQAVLLDNWDLIGLRGTAAES
jgi:hypothetical protein